MHNRHRHSPQHGLDFLSPFTNRRETLEDNGARRPLGWKHGPMGAGRAPSLCDNTPWPSVCVHTGRGWFHEHPGAGGREPRDYVMGRALAARRGWPGAAPAPSPEARSCSAQQVAGSALGEAGTRPAGRREVSKG